MIDLSIIIPMYNVESYIVETLNSMKGLHQFKIELILIDDGSTDQTLEIAKKWAVNNIIDCVIISKKNQGQSIARNLGIEKSRGQFITFFDSDDIALSYIYEQIINIMLSHDVDFCIVRGESFDHITQKNLPFSDHYVWDEIMNNDDLKILTVHQEPRIARLEPSPVVKVLKKDFIISNNIKFLENLLFEDVLFHVQCILNSKKIALLNRTLLLYRVNRSGQTTSCFGKKRTDILNIIDSSIFDYNQKKVSHDVGANLIGLLLRMNVWCSENCAFEDKAKFVEKSLQLFGQIDNSVIQTYMNKYAYNDREQKICQAFINKDKNYLNIVAEGGCPITTWIVNDNQRAKKITLESIDSKLAHLFSQQKGGWAHDRFNALNSKLELLLMKNTNIFIRVVNKIFKKISKLMVSK